MTLKKPVQIKEKPRRIIKNIVLGINVERILFISFLIFFLLLIITQIILATPVFTINMGLNMQTEGRSLKNEEYLYRHGELTLRLIGKGRGKDVKILVNGDEKDSFVNGEITIKVKNGDIIEIDNTERSNYIELEIVSKSSNIERVHVGQKFRIKQEVKKIIRVKIKNNL